MPNHLHLLLDSSNETTLEKVVQLIKGGSSHAIHQQAAHKMQIWQAGFHEESIRNMDDYLVKVSYIHLNPLNAHLVEKPLDWAYGSASNKFVMDEPPVRLRIGSSGAKAPQILAGGMSELKLRPPKKQPPAVI